jgi:protocatechuate 3,4-dioxygenase beta subunit
MHRLLWVIILTLFAGPAEAVYYEREPIPLNCRITPEVGEIERSPKFYHSNNLLRKNGEPFEAAGKKIVLMGRVLDKECLPVADARVELMQADSNGFYKHLDRLGKADPHFNGTGKTMTDNLGYFFFTTVIPGAADNRAPHLKFFVRHHELPLFETEVFFEEFGSDNDEDEYYIKASHPELLLAKYAGLDKTNNMDVYNIDLVVNGSVRYHKR